jgi:hypothetical protein
MAEMLGDTTKHTIFLAFEGKTLLARGYLVFVAMTVHGAVAGLRKRLARLSVIGRALAISTIVDHEGQ